MHKGATCDAFNITRPDAVAQTRCMENALLDGGISFAEVDYVNAHGTHTKINDVT